MNCKHENFAANVNVSRITDGDGGPVLYFHADVTIQCADCGRPFRFKGLPGGFVSDQPTVSFLATEARLPIEPTDARAN